METFAIHIKANINIRRQTWVIWEFIFNPFLYNIVVVRELVEAAEAEVEVEAEAEAEAARKVVRKTLLSL